MLPATQISARRVADLPPANVLMLEQHYTVAELAERWNVSHDFVKDLVIDEPGIIRSQAKRAGLIRVPSTVAARVYQRMQQGVKG